MLFYLKKINLIKILIFGVFLILVSEENSLKVQVLCDIYLSGTDLNCTKTKFQETIKLHEGTKLHEDKFARGDKIARRQFCTKGQF